MGAGAMSSVKPAPYGTGDTIGVLLDCEAGVMTIYKNGVSQSVCNTIPKNTEYWPMVALDYGDDKVELLR